MRSKFPNHARNVWDRAVALLPRVDQFWYKYSYMEVSGKTGLPLGFVLDGVFRKGVNKELGSCRGQATPTATLLLFFEPRCRSLVSVSSVCLSLSCLSLALSLSLWPGSAFFFFLCFGRECGFPHHIHGGEGAGLLSPALTPCVPFLALFCWRIEPLLGPHSRCGDETLENSVILRSI